MHGVTPNGDSSKDSRGYRAVVRIAKQYFSKSLYEEFAAFFQEGQYLIPLWTAHMLVEFGNPPKEIAQEDIEVIQRYSNNPLAPEVAEEEKLWLSNNHLFV